MVSRRIVSSYKARYNLTPENKAYIRDMTDAIDVHAHARGLDEEDPFHAAREATKAGWQAIIYKSISPGKPWEVGRQLQEDVDRWAEGQKLRPVKVLSAYVIGIPLAAPDFERIKAAVDGGVSAIWMPPVTSAWSLYRLGGRGMWLGKEENAVEPVAWEEALKHGVYVLDEQGKLLPAIRDTVKLAADRGIVMSFGHLSPQEMDALADACAAYGMKRAFIDHPFSEVFEFDIPKLKRWADAGLRFCFTWDELSPLLGVDPQDMVQAIREVGPEHFMLASDAGIPLLPDTVDAYRLLVVALRAYGLTEPEMRTIMHDTAAELLGIR
jgi:hypothetical protein